VVLGIMTIGAFTLNNSVFDIGVMWVFGIVGLVFHRFNIPLAPMALTLVLGPMLESNLRRALSLDTNLGRTLTENPVALVALLSIVAIFVVKAALGLRRRFSGSVPEQSNLVSSRR
jgi:putative tricarboxylic transport membrane protein